MKRSNRLVILVGLLLAVVAFVAIVVLLNNPSGGPGPDGSQEPATATVLVATADIEVGTSVTADLVEEQEIVAEAAQPGALRDVSQLADRVALFRIPAGSQVTDAAFGDAAGAPTVDIVGQLGPGEKAIAVQLDSATGLNFLVQQGDVIDIVLSQDFSTTATGATAILRANDTETVRTVSTVLQAKRVLYVSGTNIPAAPPPDDSGTPTEQPVAPTTVILVFAGTDQDAELIKFSQRDANEIGNLTITLRSPDDEAVEPTTGVTLLTLLETYGVLVPPTVPLVPAGE